MTRAPAWTADKESKFMDEYEYRWKMFQNALLKRSRRQIKSHGSYLIRQRTLLNKNSRPWQWQKPPADDDGYGGGDGDVDADEDINVDVEGEGERKGEIEG